MAADAIRVIYVDDDTQVAELASTLLERESSAIDVTTLPAATDALDELSGADCVVSDYDMPGMDGIEFLERVRESHPDLPFVLFTANGSEQVAADAVTAGATDYIQKQTTPEQFAVLANSVVTAVEGYRAERRAREREARFQALAENAADAIVTIDAESTVRFANPAVERVFGYAPDELVGESLTTVLPESLRQQHLDAVERYLETGERTVDWTGSRFTAQDADGETFPVVIAFSEFETETGRRFAGIVRDDRTRAAYPLDQDEMLDRISDGFFALDTEWRITYLNEQAAAVARGGLDRDPESLIGETYWDAVPSAEGTVFEENYRTAMETQDPVTFEAQSEVIDGWVEVRVYPSESGLSVYFRDITERKERQHQLQRKNKRLEEFASVVSHDLRSPLNVAEGYVDLITEDAPDTETRDRAEKAADALGRIDGIVESLLALARQGDVVGDASPVDLETVARRAWDTTETRAAALRVPETTTVEADADRLQELLENLFRNAIEHGADHESDLTVTVGPLDGGFYVEDDGDGIPRAERESVFQEGYSTGEENTGFGLSIVRAIARGHDWSVSLRESESGGARFEFRT